MTAKDITQAGIESATAAWYQEGLSPATINKRLNCLSKMGVSVEGLRVKNPKSLKWHLREDEKVTLLAELRALSSTHWDKVANFIEWTTLTGLRIEESLRLTWGDIGVDGAVLSDVWVFSSVTVPGTKTATSQATLPLGAAAGKVLRSLWEADPQCRGKTDPVFNLTYEDLAGSWSHIRFERSWKDDPTATLKALRRSAARYLHVDCGMPLHMVQQYLRHESMDTTLEYLRLTGGYGTEEMRRYLK